VSGRPLSVRLVGATLLVACVTACSLAATAAVVARIFWQQQEGRRVEDSARAVAAAIRADEKADGLGLQAAALDVLQESGLADHRLEVWRGSTLVAASVPGPPLGPPEAVSANASWIMARQTIEGDATVLVAAPKDQGRRALNVFVWSLAVAAPLCLGLAFVVGHAVSRRATRPLADFRDRIVAARPGSPLPASAPLEAPSEVRDLDAAFSGLWARLEGALAREREFAANASHELRTPLTRLRLHLERARRAAGSLPVRELDQAMAEVDRMVRLVDSLLVLARDVATGLPSEVVNVADVARQAVGRAFPPTDSVVVDAPDEALVSGDEDLLAIAVDNLLDNARKFSAQGPIALTVASARETVTLSVTSPGARVEAGDRERVFERFYRAPEARPGPNGHGLGLPLTRHIARLHGGDSRCASGPEEDARFVLEIPAWKPRA